MILVSGGTGFIGSKIIKKLVEQGWDVAGLYRKESSLKRLSGNNGAVKWVLSDDVHLYDFFANNIVDGIIHCATNYGRDNNELHEVIETNVVFPLKLLQYACQSGSRFFINTDSFYTREIDNEWKVDHKVYMNSYCKSKFIFRECARENVESLDIAFVNVELQHIYGCGDGKGKFVSYLINQLKQNVEEIELSEGTQVRDWTYVDDAVGAYLTVLSSIDKHDRGMFYSYEVGTGKGTSLRDFCVKAKEISGADTVLSFGKRPMNKDELAYSVANNKALIDLGWNPQIDLDEGIRRLFEE